MFNCTWIAKLQYIFTLCILVMTIGVPSIMLFATSSPGLNNYFYIFREEIRTIGSAGKEFLYSKNIVKLSSTTLIKP